MKTGTHTQVPVPMTTVAFSLLYNKKDKKLR